ncbi:MAG TPA: hypothetical protein VIM46_05095, partial [Luteolibacter sp.]
MPHALKLRLFDFRELWCFSWFLFPLPSFPEAIRGIRRICGLLTRKVPAPGAGGGKNAGFPLIGAP